MKYCTLLVLGLFEIQISMAQENRISFDFVITVDEEIASTLSKAAILVKLGSDVQKRIEISYHPGNLSLNSKDYGLILSDQKSTLFLQFDYYQYSSKRKQRIYNYEIEIGKDWFEKTFVILKIYNLDKRKYRRKLDPLSNDRNYTYDLETSQGQVLRSNKW